MTGNMSMGVHRVTGSPLDVQYADEETVSARRHEVEKHAIGRVAHALKADAY